VRPANFSRAAIDVTRKLQQARVSRLYVGGAVRDLCAGSRRGLESHDATPEQIKPLFPAAPSSSPALRLVHVLLAQNGRGSTFRGKQVGDDTADEHGRLSPTTFSASSRRRGAPRLHDQTPCISIPRPKAYGITSAGVAGRQGEKSCVLIGDPVHALSRGSVRMLRAVRLAAKLGIDIREKDRSPDSRGWRPDPHLPPARVFDEMEVTLSGHPSSRFKSLAGTPASRRLPLLDVILEQPLARGYRAALASTDERVRTGKPVTSAFLSRRCFGKRCWQAGTRRRRKASGQCPRCSPRWSRAGAAGGATRDPPSFRSDDKETWALQPRFEQRAPRPFRFARASALPRPGTIFSGCAAMRGRFPSSSPTGGNASSARQRQKRSACSSRRGAEETSALARPRAQAQGGARRTYRAQRHRSTEERDGSVAYIGLGQQSGPPPAAGARVDRARAPAAHATRRGVRQLPDGPPWEPASRHRTYVNRGRGVTHRTRARRMLRHLRAIGRRHGRGGSGASGATRRACSTSICCSSGRRRLGQSRLIVPHPRMHERASCWRPLRDIALGNDPGAAPPNVAAQRGGQRIDRTRTAFWR